MPGPPEKYADTGLSKVAHAIRRTGALYIATMLLPEGTSEQELLGMADRLAAWIGGNAQRQEDARQGQPSEFLGQNPWAPD